jgi:hypothetical protein
MQTWARRKGGIGTPDELGAVELLVTGGACGIVTWMSTYPFDVIKTRCASASPGSGQPRVRIGPVVPASPHGLHIGLRIPYLMASVI